MAKRCPLSPCPDGRRCQTYHGLKTGVGFAGSRGDFLEFLQLLEEVFDQMPPFACVGIVGGRIKAAFPGGNDGREVRLLFSKSRK